MNCFTLMAVGHMARNPEVIAKGNLAYTRFCLIGNDYGGRDDVGVAREITTSLWFSAFGAIGDSIAQHARKGDQLIVEARVKSNIWTDKQGEKQYDHTFVVQGFRFGAPGKLKREEFNGRREQPSGLPRAEEYGNGHDPHAAQTPGGAGSGHEGSRDGGPDEVGGHEEVEAELPDVAPDFGVVDSVSGESGSTMEVRESSGPSGPAGVGTRPAQSHAVGPARAPSAPSSAEQTKTSQEAKATQQKPRGSRSSRKTPVSAA